MSATSDPEFDARTSDELVAYLDGELPPEECRRVEERLAADADYRQQLRDLDQAWEALNSLPATNVDEHFTQTTIEMVTVAAQREASQHAAQVGAASRKRYWRWALAGLAAAVVGFTATRTFLPDADDALIADLPLIQQVDVLSQIDSVDFLQRLIEDVPIERLTHDSASFERELAAFKSASAESPADRRRWIMSLAPVEKATLASQANRFNAIKQEPVKLSQLVQLQQGIRNAADSDKLQRTLVAYGQWLAQREPWEQEDLRLLAAEERVDLIQRIMRDDEQRAARHLSDNDKDNLRREIFEIFSERKSAFERAMRRRDRDIHRWLEGPPGGQALMVVLWELRDDDRDNETTERLIKQLGDEQRKYWESLPRRSRHRQRRDQRDQLVLWIREAIHLRPGPEELDRFFSDPDKLDSDQRQWLLSLPRDEMEVQLERLYMADQLGLRGTAEWLSEYHRPGGIPSGPQSGELGAGRDSDLEGRGGPSSVDHRDRQSPPNRPRPPAPIDPPAKGEP
jgi:hypothetical protein